jgi:hypothetical protein
VIAPGEAVGQSLPALTFSPRCSGLPEDGMWKCDPVFVDVNGDCHLDLAAIPRLGNGAHVWLGNGRGEWIDSSVGLDPGHRSCGGGLDFGDLNGDGHLDLAVADHCDGVYVYLGDGTGVWEVATESMDLTDEVIQQRLADLPPFEPKIQKGWLARYVKHVTSANTGAVLQS